MAPAHSELLTEGQYLSFLTDGFIELRPTSLDDGDHANLYERANALYATGRALGSPTVHLDVLGDNVLAQVPEIERVLTDPVIDGALTSVLGPSYLTHPHHYCHRSADRDQAFHQDGNLPWNERGHYRSHRPDWAMLFYYPQDVDETNGPTEVVPGSQYWTVDNETTSGAWYSDDRIDRSLDDSILSGPDLELRDRHQTEGLSRGLGVPELERRFLHLRAGTVILAHYDLIHRGSRVAGHPDPRYMYKFYFARAYEPERRSWSFDQPSSGRLDLTAVDSRLAPVVEAVWRWSAGKTDPDGGGGGGEVEADGAAEIEWQWQRHAAALGDGREDEKVAAAYRLGGAVHAGNDAGLSELERALSAETESTRRAAGIGLRQAGPAGLASLLRGLESPDAPTRRPSVAGLGTATAARSATAVAVVIAVLGRDPDDLVRSNAAYSLGQIARCNDLATPPGAIVEALLERLEPGVEPPNAFSASFARSTVRQSAAFGLALTLVNHSLSDDLLDRVVDGPLRDHDRYVQGLVAEGLARAPRLAPAARQRMVRYLASRRWNPVADAQAEGTATESWKWGRRVSPA